MKKRILSIILIFALIATMTIIPVSATSHDDGIEPRYEVMTCDYCGAAARVVDKGNGQYAGIATVSAGKCPLNKNLGAHTHNYYRTYVTINCPNCGLVDMLYSSYYYCPVVGGYIY